MKESPPKQGRKCARGRRLAGAGKGFSFPRVVAVHRFSTSDCRNARNYTTPNHAGAMGRRGRQKPPTAAERGIVLICILQRWRLQFRHNDTLLTNRVELPKPGILYQNRNRICHAHCRTSVSGAPVQLPRRRLSVRPRQHHTARAMNYAIILSLALLLACRIRAALLTQQERGVFSGCA